MSSVVSFLAGPVGTDELLRWSLFGLLLVAIFLAILAASHHARFNEDARIERALRLTDYWYEPQGTEPSPDACFTRLNSYFYGTIASLHTLQTSDPIYIQARAAFITLHNYLFRALAQYERGFIDRDYFFAEQGVIVTHCGLILRDYYPIFCTKENWLDMTRPGEKLDEYYASYVKNHLASRGTTED